MQVTPEEADELRSAWRDYCEVIAELDETTAGQLVGTVYNGVISSDGSTTVTIGQIMLPAGSYVLEISGTVNGSFAGGYTRSLDLVPVPLPASFALLLAGLLGFTGLFVQRSRNR